MSERVKKNKEVIMDDSVKESRPKKSKYENKQRSTINVSLQKRNLGLLNSILNGWVEDGYNISNEICKAIIFKNKSDINPHIRTILSTLSLIESSLKSQKVLKSMTEEEIDSKALEIFNEVITIDIDGAKLTNLLKSVDMPVRKQASSKTELESLSENTLEKPTTYNATEIQSKKETPIKDSFLENEKEYEKEINSTVEDKGEVKNIELSNTNNKKEENTNIDWTNAFPNEKIGEKKQNNTSIYNGFMVTGGFA